MGEDNKGYEQMWYKLKHELRKRYEICLEKEVSDVIEMMDEMFEEMTLGILTNESPV